MRQEFLAQYVGPNDDQEILSAWMDFIETVPEEDEA